MQLGCRPSGSDYFICTQNINVVNDKFTFKSGGLRKKHVVESWNLGSHLIICL